MCAGQDDSNSHLCTQDLCKCHHDSRVFVRQQFPSHLSWKEEFNNIILMPKCHSLVFSCILSVTHPKCTPGGFGATTMQPDVLQVLETVGVSLISQILKKGKDKGQSIGDRIKDLREIVALWLGYTAETLLSRKYPFHSDWAFYMEQLMPTVGDLTLWVLQHRSNAFF